MREAQSLTQRICQFLESAGGSAPTPDIIAHFGDTVPQSRMALFRQLLKQVQESHVLPHSKFPLATLRVHTLNVRNSQSVLEAGTECCRAEAKASPWQTSAVQVSTLKRVNGAKAWVLKDTYQAPP